MTESRKLRVFLCHSSNDKLAVRELYQRLKAEGWIDPWLDEEKLYPGQDWDLEIEKAVEAADAVIVFLSNNSVTKEGYVQRELRFVLRIADFKPEGTVFVIPIRLDDCPMPRRLSMWQYVDYFPKGQKDWAYQRLLGSLKVRAGKMEIPTVSSVEEQVRREGEEKLAEKKKLVIQEKSDKKTEQLPDNLSIGNMEFLRIPKGKFIMGDESEKHEVEIPYDYFLARFPVTNQLFEKFVDATSLNKSWWLYGNWNEKLDHPVVDVSWHTAQAYCKWFNQEYGSELPGGLVFRLPTEAEWEKAARGTDSRLYPWGNEFDKNKCNSRETSFNSRTTPVGNYSHQGDSPYGIADMAGNVEEWTHSLHQPYPYKIDDGREYDSANDLRVLRRVLRGGSFNGSASHVRTSYRSWEGPIRSIASVGFRVALAPPLPK